MKLARRGKKILWEHQNMGASNHAITKLRKHGDTKHGTMEAYKNQKPVKTNSVRPPIAANEVNNGVTYRL